MTQWTFVDVWKPEFVVRGIEYRWVNFWRENGRPGSHFPPLRPGIVGWLDQRCPGDWVEVVNREIEDWRDITMPRLDALDERRAWRAERWDRAPRISREIAFRHRRDAILFRLSCP